MFLDFCCWLTSKGAWEASRGPRETPWMVPGWFPDRQKLDQKGAWIDPGNPLGPQILTQQRPLDGSWDVQKTDPNLTPRWPCTHGITWNDIPWMTSMGYMYPMDDIHGTQVCHGCHPQDTFITWSSMSYETIFLETMSRLFAVVGCAPLGSYYSPLGSKPALDRVFAKPF